MKNIWRVGQGTGHAAPSVHQAARYLDLHKLIASDDPIDT